MSTTTAGESQGQVKHDYVFDKLKEEEEELYYQPCVKLTVYFKKRKDISFDDFVKHWSHVHADLTMASKPFGACKVQRYSQCRQFPQQREGLARMGLTPLEYDGISTMWFKKWDDLESFFAGPASEAKLTEDCYNFIDMDHGVRFYAGQDTIMLGKGIPDIDDSNGLLESNQLNGESEQ